MGSSLKCDGPQELVILGYEGTSWISAKTIILTFRNFVLLIIKTAIMLKNMSYNERLEINFWGFRITVSNPSPRTIVIIAMVLIFLLIIRFFSFN